MAGYYDPYTEEWIETDDQAAADWYNDSSNTSVDYGYDDNYYGYGDYDWSVSDLPDYQEVGGDIWGSLKSIATRYGPKIFDAAKRMVTNDKGETDWGKIAGIAGGLYGLYRSQSSAPQQTGYQGGIPEYTAVRAPVEQTYDPNRRPGSGGQRYFSDTQYVGKDGDVEAAKTAAKEESTGLAAINKANLARQERPSATKEAVAKAEDSAAVQEGVKASDVIEDLPVPQYAQGGIATLAKGGNPRYLAGQTDGMADKIPANIDGKQQAALSHGEFVIPADVVSHLGNGNSDAGAERLYAMMDRIRQARTGTKKQGKKINPDKYLAA